MKYKSLSIFLIVLCFFLQHGVCQAADKVVVIPMTKNPFQGDQYHTISSVAFTLNSSSTGYSRPYFIHSYGYLQIDNALTAAFASVNLPHGSVISEMTTYAKDAGQNCNMIFSKKPLNGDDAVAINGGTNTGVLNTDEYGPITQPIAEEVIDNQHNQYILTWYCSGIGSVTDHLYAVRFKYRIE